MLNENKIRIGALKYVHRIIWLQCYYQFYKIEANGLKPLKMPNSINKEQAVT